MNPNRNEAETRAELIDPALMEAGWGVVEHSRVGREMIAPGRLLGGGKRAKPSIADYVLVYRNQKLAVIEAKQEKLGVTAGLGQAKRDAQRLQTPFTYTTNGHGIYQVDMLTGEEGDVDEYPSPQELWDLVYGASVGEAKAWGERFTDVAFENKGGQWEPRFYQHNAIENTLDAIAGGSDRILLTLATGTGKTAIAFQIAWKLFHGRWNLTDWRDGLAEAAVSKRRPRILFLADRNFLADQAFNAFNAFDEDALVRIDPESIRKKGGVPKNRSVFFTIFQTFMTGTGEDGEPAPNFGEYPPDFFDLIFIDECHRGGANDESTWRGILEYFSPAVQIGLTATPKRTENVDTYAYFGEPVYVYSLKEGINDGYLTPFKVQQIQTTLDEYVFTDDDVVIAGEIDEGRTYDEDDFNRIIEIRERERRRIAIMMEQIDQSQKTLVFCRNQEHALVVRDLINQHKKSSAVDYCVRVTADDGEIGDKHLRTFQDNEKTIPTILTTSHKLSTGVDARNIRNIVLMRPIKSMIEFKQIVGRGTRTFDNKDFFTVYDFVQAYHHFNDPEWDGEPIDPIPPETPDPPQEPGEAPTVDDPLDPRPEKIRVKLADGKELLIDHMIMTSYWTADGRPVSSDEFLRQLYGDLPGLFEDEQQLRQLWSAPDTRRHLLDRLRDRGYGPEQLAELSKLVDAEDSDVYDVLAHIAYAAPTLTRSERVSAHESEILSPHEEQMQEFLRFVLDQYVAEGVGELDGDKLPALISLKYATPHDAVKVLGDIDGIRNAFIGFQKHLYASDAAA